MKVGIFLATTSGKAKQDIMRSFAAGVKASGDLAKIFDKREYRKCDLALIFGFYNDQNMGAIQSFRKKVYETHESRGRKCLFVDADFLRFAGKIRAEAPDDPTQHLRISHGSIFPSRANYFNEFSDNRRWKELRRRKHIVVKDYRTDGDHILMLLNSSSKYGRGWSARGTDSMYWLQKSLSEIRQYTDRPIRVRFHPNEKKDLRESRPVEALQKMYGNITFSGGVVGSNKAILPPRTLIEDCDNAWAAVVHTTSASVIPIINGIPVFTSSRDCIAFPIATHRLSKIEKPSLPKREQWFYDLSYSLWNVEELRDGVAWKRIKSRINSSGDYSKAKAKKLGII